MRVLQIGLGNNPGGVEAFVMNYYQELVSYKIQFDFACMYDHIAHEGKIKALGGKVYYVPNVKRNPRGYYGALYEILQREDYDVVHVNMLSAANIVPLRVARKVGVPKIIAHSHNASAPGILRRIMHSWNKPFVERYATHYFACGEKAAQWLFSRKTRESGRVTLIANAIDVDKYRYSKEERGKIRKQLGLEGKLVIGHVGRFEEQKNHKKMLKIMGKLYEKRQDIVLLCIGEGVKKKEMEQIAEKNGLTKAICFPGKQENIGPYLSAMDVFLMPSLFEGLPFTLLEAQANGLSCVVSDTITEEAYVRPQAICALSLQAEESSWSEAVLQMAAQGRCSYVEAEEALTRHGFNIKSEARRLRDLYQM